MSIIRALFDVFSAVLRSIGASLLLLTSNLIATLAVLALLGFVAFSLSGVLGLRITRRKRE